MVRHILRRLREGYTIALDGVGESLEGEQVGDTYLFKPKTLLRLFRAAGSDKELTGGILGLVRANPGIFAGKSPNAREQRVGLENGLGEIIDFLGTGEIGVEDVRRRFFEKVYARDTSRDHAQEYD